MTSIKSKCIWITGASSGIGEALAHACAEKGAAKLILSARKENELQRVAREIETINPNVATIIQPLDLSNTASIEHAGKKILENNIIDILINNGGISQRDTVINTQMDVYRRLMEVNYFGLVHLTKLVLPQMKSHKQGHILAMSSVAGKLGTPKRSGYAAAKHAVHGFMDSLRAETHDDNIKATTICGGYIRTQISVNALTGVGTSQNTMDINQEKGLTPDYVASKILQAIARNKPEIYIGGKEIMGIYVSRYFPSLLRRIVRKVNPE